MTDLSDILGRIPTFRGGVTKATRLGGLSNANYRIDGPGGPYVLRIPDPDPGPFVNRAREIEATRMATDLGIGPTLVHAEPSGLLVTRWLDTARTMKAAAYRDEPDAITRLGRTLSRLHGSGRTLAGRFDLRRILDSYASTCLERTGGLPWSPAAQGRIETSLDASERSPRPTVPSHCDLVPENSLDDGARMFLVDWEYAAMADPAWDLSYAAMEADFNATQEHALLAAYGDPSIARGRFQVMKLIAAAIGGLWELLKATDTEGEHQTEKARRYVTLAETLAAHPNFDLWLASYDS